MRQYEDEYKKILKKVVCNQCGRELKLENGIVQEGVFQGTAPWGYFSEKDGQIHHFDLCESCYERLTAGFQIPVTEEEQTELL